MVGVFHGACIDGALSAIEVALCQYELQGAASMNRLLERTAERVESAASANLFGFPELVTTDLASDPAASVSVTTLDYEQPDQFQGGDGPAGSEARRDYSRPLVQPHRRRRDVQPGPRFSIPMVGSSGPTSSISPPPNGRPANEPEIAGRRLSRSQARGRPRPFVTTWSSRRPFVTLPTTARKSRSFPRGRGRRLDLSAFAGVRPLGRSRTRCTSSTAPSSAAISSRRGPRRSGDGVRLG